MSETKDITIDAISKGRYPFPWNSERVTAKSSVNEWTASNLFGDSKKSSRSFCYAKIFGLEVLSICQREIFRRHPKNGYDLCVDNDGQLALKLRVYPTVKEKESLRSLFFYKFQRRTTRKQYAPKLIEVGGI